MRIVSLISSATEIIHALGMTKNLVGISHECDYPDDIQNLPICTEPRFDISGKSLEIDRDVKSIVQDALSVYQIHESIINDLQPDFIITQTQCKVCAVTLDDVRLVLKNKLGLNAKIISLEPNSLSDVWSDIHLISSALQIDDRGHALVKNIQREISQIKSMVYLKKRQSVACIEWIEPLMYAGNWVPEMVEIAGGFSVFGKKGEHSSWSDYSTLIKSNPDKIILMPCGYDIKKTQKELNTLFNISGWSDLKAVKSNNVFITDGNQYFNRPGPRLVDSIKILFDIISDKNELFGYKGKGWVRLLC
ncbi:MAG: cobalamin-binding protein [Candidatus Marinimicrobia bacterium]|nr:cobalamin-binding protein [Candidatus Neomarinimicrobiota bacterium]|tara:strand:- start:117 stop:1031 length:915 start_codon:yes stop_codon:yes gene_type:complete